MSGLADIYVDDEKVAMCKFFSQVDNYTERKPNDPVVVETCDTLSRNGLKKNVAPSRKCRRLDVESP